MLPRNKKKLRIEVARQKDFIKSFLPKNVINQKTSSQQAYYIPYT